MLAPWTLVIFGPPRQRKIASIHVMEAIEERCPTLWSADVDSSLKELRAGESCDVGVEARSVHLSPPGAWLRSTIGKSGKNIVQRAARAANCFMKHLGTNGLFAVGTVQERRCAWDYLERLMLVNFSRLTTKAVFISAAKTELAKKEGRELDQEGEAPKSVDWQDVEAKDGRPVIGSMVKIIKECKWKGKMGKLITDNGSEEPYRVEGAGVYQMYRVDEVELVKVWSLKTPVQDLKGQPWVTSVPATRRQCAWLEPRSLRGVEEKTDTIIVIDHGTAAQHVGGYAWESAAMSFIYVCGHDAKCRASAADKVRRMVADILAEDAPEAVEETPLDEKDAPLSHLTKAREVAAAAAATAEAESEVADVSEPEKKKLKGAPKALPKSGAKPPPEETEAPTESILNEKSDPMKVLRSLPRWPVNINEWSGLQDVIWSGHVALKDGWIRVWSRSKDSEYYYFPTSGKTTFDRSEVVKF